MLVVCICFNWFLMLYKMCFNLKEIIIGVSICILWFFVGGFYKRNRELSIENELKWKN